MKCIFKFKNTMCSSIMIFLYVKLHSQYFDYQSNLRGKSIFINPPILCQLNIIIFLFVISQ